VGLKTFSSEPIHEHLYILIKIITRGWVVEVRLK
jgi:hypothetical protein